MKERDYINTTDLAKVRMMNHILHEIGAFNKDMGTIEEYQTVAQITQKWHDRLYKLIDKP